MTIDIQRRKARQEPDHLQHVLPDNQHHLVTSAQPHQVGIRLLEQKIPVLASGWEIVGDDQRVINVKNDVESLGHILVNQPLHALLLDCLVDQLGTGLLFVSPDHLGESLDLLLDFFKTLVLFLCEGVLSLARRG